MTESDCFRIYFFYFISIESGESAMPSRDGVYHGALCISPPPPPPPPCTQCPIVERLTNSLMMHGRNNGKKMLSLRIVRQAFEIIHLLTGEVCEALTHYTAAGLWHAE